MPAISTPRHAPPEQDRREPGFGGRPPLHNRPTGGGGDGDNGDDGLRRRGPRELLGRYRLGLAFLLAGDLIFFLSLVSAFFVHSSGGHFDAADHYIPDWHPFTIPTALWFSTGFLILSSATAEYGRRQLFREMDVIEEWLGLGRPMARRTWPWLAATAALGCAYLGAMSIAWDEIASEGIRFGSSAESALFFTLTGSHAIHIGAGLLLLGAGCVGLYRFRRVEQRQILVDCIAWFWHSMSAIWALLFALLVWTR